MLSEAKHLGLDRFPSYIHVILSEAKHLNIGRW